MHKFGQMSAPPRPPLRGDQFCLPPPARPANRIRLVQGPNSPWWRPYSFPCCCSQVAREESRQTTPLYRSRLGQIAKTAPTQNTTDRWRPKSSSASRTTGRRGRANEAISLAGRIILPLPITLFDLIRPSLVAKGWLAVGRR